MTSQPTTTEWAAARRAELDQLFAARLAAPADGDPGRLLEAMRYSLLAPGKRIRPLLALAAAETVGRVDADVLVACGAVELIHCYSLIHDDLPAMDDDDFRRGRPSNHKAFGEATAILAGDALLTLAFDWIADAGERAGRPGPFLAASRALARAAGAFGMVRGQARDLGQPAPTTLGALETLHAEKTGALFRAALEVGGHAAGAAPDAIAALARYGAAYGIAFQHADDKDDEEHSAHADAARARLESLIGEACAAVAPLGPRGERLVALAQALGERARAR
ncbi:MAG TPA: polyprenyl synthetase family protein [Polyangia bacterium]